ncbi:MAG: 1-acyl-sn-glycerol-3-phosphate acyltransferase [Gammaproteobacteria bacterium]|nr:1-acyl-sn-glycerol-3-phosphate acyltransferase [Gammaproteobacteria bacterium]
MLSVTIFPIVVAVGIVLVLLWRRLMRACEAANGADWGRRWLNRLDGFNRILCRRFHRLNHDVLDFPAAGGVLVASNHVSGLDPLLLIAASPRPLRFLIAREEYDRWWLRWLFRAVGCIPVERARNPRAALVAARAALERGEVVALFPHGRIHLDHHPPTPLKRGIVLLSRLTGAPILPVRVEGVRGQGRTVAAVFMPSRARVRGFPPLPCDGLSEDECLGKLWDVLATHHRHDNPHRRRQDRHPETAD